MEKKNLCLPFDALCCCSTWAFMSFPMQLYCSVRENTWITYTSAHTHTHMHTDNVCLTPDLSTHFKDCHREKDMFVWRGRKATLLRKVQVDVVNKSITSEGTIGAGNSWEMWFSTQAGRLYLTWRMENVRQLLLLHIHSNMWNGKVWDLAHLRLMPQREMPCSSCFSHISIKTVWKLKDDITGAVNLSADSHNILLHQDDILKGCNYIFCMDVRQDKDGPLENTSRVFFWHCHHNRNTIASSSFQCR